jgi:protein-S-isoprenylcysteine O-methyltransferase Ste14
MADIRDYVFRLRSYTPLPLVAILLFIARPTPISMTIGILLVVFGEIIRIWAVAHAGGATRTRDVGAPYLVTSGPYAYVRNPLYFGNVTIYLGVATIGAQQLLWLLPLTLIYFTIQYKLIISLEEDKLVELFGQQYETYRSKVPSLFPYKGRTTPLDERASDWKESFRSERSTFGSTSIILLVLIGYAFWRGEGW